MIKELISFLANPGYGYDICRVCFQMAYPGYMKVDKMCSLGKSFRKSVKCFQFIPNIPVVISKYDPELKKLGNDICDKLKNLLDKWDLVPKLIGSTELEIDGKNELDISIYLPSDKLQNEIAEYILLNFPGTKKNKYLKLNCVMLEYQNTQAEIFLRFGQDVINEKILMNHLKNRFDSLSKYIELKQKYSYSAHEYFYQKNQFFADILDLYANENV